MTRTSITLRTTSPEEKEFLEAMTKDMAGDEHSRRRAAVVLSLLAGKKLHSAAEQAGVGIGTARKILSQYNKVGWTGLLYSAAQRWRFPRTLRPRILGGTSRYRLP